MTDASSEWRLIDTIATKLGAKPAALKKWRQRGVPYKWQVLIVQNARGRLDLSDFAGLLAKKAGA